MKLSNLKPAAGSTHSRRRIGRGPGSGLGGTSTRGHKGAKARSGYKRKIGFEGGQMPLQRRLTKGGFKIIYHKEDCPVNFLGNGELKAKLEVEAHAFSKSAEEAIKAVGGNATII